MEDYTPLLKRAEADNAWLGLGNITKLHIKNALDKKSTERPGLELVRLMRNPDYLGFAAEVLFNVYTLPAQNIVLKELWTRPFPMYWLCTLCLSVP